MSVFSSNNWPPSCSSANQSPINLSQSGAKPCNLSCDLVMDDGNVSQASVSVSNEGLVLQSPMGLGTCKFRGESYVCQAISVNHPSNHTIEGIQADGEIVAIFRKPTGELMCMSSLFRISGTQTPSYSFFKQFVPYAVSTGEIKLQMRDWSISQMVPPEASYYVYQGSSLVPPCAPCEWIVFKSMINMDQGDFAYLVRNVEAGSRPIQGLGEREVFFNDINNIPGGPMPHDNKYYLKLRPTGNTRVGKLETKKADLKGNAGPSAKALKDEAENPSTTAGALDKTKNDYVKENGWIGLVLAIVCAVGVCVAGYYGSKWAFSSPPITGEFVVPVAVKTREGIWWVLTTVWNFYVWVFNTMWTTVSNFFSGSTKIFVSGEEAVGELEEAARKGAVALGNVADKVAAEAKVLTPHSS